MLPSSLPISHGMDKIISLYHVCRDQWKAEHTAEPIMSWEGTLRSLWIQHLSFDWPFAEDIWIIVRRAENDLLFIAGNFMGPSMERGVRGRITLGLIGPAGKKQMQLKQSSVYVHMQTEILGKASRAH